MFLKSNANNVILRNDTHFLTAKSKILSLRKSPQLLWRLYRVQRHALPWVFCFSSCCVHLLPDGYHGITLKPVCVPIIPCSKPSERTANRGDVCTRRSSEPRPFSSLPPERGSFHPRGDVNAGESHKLMRLILINTVSLIGLFMFLCSQRGLSSGQGINSVFLFVYSRYYKFRLQIPWET